MAYKTNPAYGGDRERELFHRLRENKHYVLETICAEDLSFLQEAFQEYASLDQPKLAEIKEDSSRNNWPIVRARRRRYYDFLHRKTKLEESDGNYPAEKKALLDFYSLNLPLEFLFLAWDKYALKQRVVPKRFFLTRTEIKQISAELSKLHSGLVRELAWKMFALSQTNPDSANLDPNELIQAGNCGLSIAIQKYDLNRDAHFSTYARWWVYQEINQYIRLNRMK